MDIEEIRRELSAGLLIPIGAGAAAAAYVISPMVAWMNPVSLATFGTAGAVGFALMLSSVHNARTQAQLLRNWWGGLILFVGSFLLLIPSMNRAQAALQRWETQCAALQRDMMLLKPHRADSATLFEAMACKPTSVTPLQFSDRPVLPTR